MSVNIGEVETVRSTEKAILVSDGDEDHWIPKAAIHEDSEVWKDDQSGDLVVHDWFARKKGWD
jgi:hypothetical protein